SLPSRKAVGNSAWSLAILFATISSDVKDSIFSIFMQLVFKDVDALPQCVDFGIQLYLLPHLGLFQFFLQLVNLALVLLDFLPRQYHGLRLAIRAHLELLGKSHEVVTLQDIQVIAVAMF